MLDTSRPEETADEPVLSLKKGPGNVSLGAAFLAVLLSVQAFTKTALAEDRVEPPPSEQTNPEVAKVLALERGFFEFGKKILPKLDRFVEDENIREKIRRAFHRVSENEKNRNRFHPGQAVPYGQETGFHYAFHDGTKVPAKFRGLSRTIFLPEDFDPEDIGDLLYFLHEVVHVEHDDELRRTVPWDRYRAFWNSDELLCVVDQEVDGVSVEVEALNVFFDGNVRESAHGRSRPAPIPAKRKDVARNLRFNAASHFGPGGLRPSIERICRDVLKARMFTPDLREPRLP